MSQWISLIIPDTYVVADEIKVFVALVGATFCLEMIATVASLLGGFKR